MFTFERPRPILAALLKNITGHIEPLTAQGRLEDVPQFENIILVANPDGSVVRLKDVARIELGAENYGWFGQLNGKPAAILAVYQLPDANALDVAHNVKVEMENVTVSV